MIKKVIGKQKKRAFGCAPKKIAKPLAYAHSGSVNFRQLNWRDCMPYLFEIVSMAFVALEKLHQLYDGYRRVFHIDGREWILLQEEGKHYCIANQCPHLQAPLAQASLANHILRCPSHGIEFDLRSGMPVNPKSCRHALSYLPLVYDANQIGLDLN